eukprot:5662261-Alexandrium_andersonii.AAC.1
MEFAHRRASEEIYKSWFDGTLGFGPPVREGLAPVSVARFDDFDPTPLALSKGEGRLLVPERLFAKWGHHEGAQIAIEAFMAKHYEEFLQGDRTLASIREAGHAAPASSGVAQGGEPTPPPSGPEDPTSAEGLAALTFAGTCTGWTGKSKLHITESGRIYMSIQVDHGVLAGQRVFLC